MTRAKARRTWANASSRKQSWRRNKSLRKRAKPARLERERTMTELKRELGRLVVNTTAKVTGKVLTPEDQKRLQEEAARQVAS